MRVLAFRPAVLLVAVWAAGILLGILRDKHGSGTRAAVFPCGAIQLAV